MFPTHFWPTDVPETYLHFQHTIISRHGGHFETKNQGGIMEKFWDRFPNFSGESRKFSNVIPMNSPCDAHHKYMKEIHFRPFLAVFDFLSTMFQVMYYLHYRFSRPVLSCVMSGPSELSIGAIKFFGLFSTLWSVCESLHGVAHNTVKNCQQHSLKAKASSGKYYDYSYFSNDYFV